MLRQFVYCTGSSHSLSRRPSATHGLDIRLRNYVMQAPCSSTEHPLPETLVKFMEVVDGTKPSDFSFSNISAVPEGRIRELHKVSWRYKHRVSHGRTSPHFDIWELLDNAIANHPAFKDIQALQLAFNRRVPIHGKSDPCLGHSLL